MIDRCVVCGEVVPEGRMVCPNCEMGNSLFCPCDGTKLKIISTTGTGYIYRCPECGYILGVD